MMKRTFRGKRLLAGAFALLMLAGCGSAFNAGLPAQEKDAAGVSASEEDSALLSRELAESFLKYWEDFKEEGFVLPQVQVLCADCCEDFDREILFVVPVYKTCRAVVYGAAGKEVRQIGEIDCGYTFDFSGRKEGMLRTTSVLSSAHASETNYTYYSVSQNGLASTLSISELETEGKTSGACLYEDGEGTEISLADFHERKEEADGSFRNGMTVCLNEQGALGLNEFFDLSGEGSLAEYIQKRL